MITAGQVTRNTDPEAIDTILDTSRMNHLIHWSKHWIDKTDDENGN